MPFWVLHSYRPSIMTAGPEGFGGEVLSVGKKKVKLP